MNALQFRPRAEALEDRSNPVSPADVFSAAATTQANVAILEYATDHPGTFTIATNAPSTKAVANGIVAQSQKAVSDLDQFMADLAAEIQKNPAASGELQAYLNQAATVRLQALTNMGTAQLIVNFIDITNRINADAQKALSTAMQLGVIDTNGTVAPGLTNTNGASVF